MKFAYKLQELRKGSGMSQEEFAELLGVSRQSVSKWESGKGYPEIDKLIFISNYFNTSLDLLLKDTTDYGNSNPSLSGSKSTRGSKRSKKKTINLTKSQDTSDFNNQAVYMSDPMPNKKKESYPLRRVSVSANAQVRPIKNHKFGNNKRRFNALKIFGLMATVATFIGAICVILGMSISNNSYYDNEITVETEIAIDEDYDYYGLNWLDYDITWETLYDDDMTSELEIQMFNSINSQLESVLVDTSGNVYYTGFDVVATYYEAQFQMKNELNCMLLYQKYCTLNGYNFRELYSEDFGDWVIINDAMLRVYEEQDYDSGITLIDDVSYDFEDILNSNISYYSDWNNAPFKSVFRINKQSKANVSSDILDLCFSAMEDRKINLRMTDYISMYEDYNSKYELVNYNNGSITFVPKDFIIIRLTDLDE